MGANRVVEIAELDVEVTGETICVEAAPQGPPVDLIGDRDAPSFGGAAPLQDLVILEIIGYPLSCTQQQGWESPPPLFGPLIGWGLRCRLPSYR